MGFSILSLDNYIFHDILFITKGFYTMVNDLGFVEAWEAMKAGNVISTDYSMGIQKSLLPVSDITIKKGGIEGSTTLSIDYSNQTDNHDAKLFFELRYNKEGDEHLIVAEPLVIEKSTDNVIYIRKDNYEININRLMKMKFTKYEFGKTPSISFLSSRY
jgi:hypothetical protein